MKKKILIIVCFFASFMLHAAVLKTVSVTVGGLSTALTTTEIASVTDLTVTGSIDARDIKFMRDGIPNLAVLNLSGASIKAYTGTGGTVTTSTTYVINEMPLNSFLKINNSGKTTLKSVFLPNTLTSIGISAFNSCSALNSITIPSTVLNIGNYAFYNCYGLTTLIIPNSVTTIGRQAFVNCSGLTNMTIPNSITSISDYMFSSCTGLTNVTIPTSVTSLGASAFLGCSGLTSVTIPGSVVTIGESAFSACSSLINVTIPSSVTSIGVNSFSNCTGLSSVTIPSTVSTIGDWAFSNCTKLAAVTIPSSVKTIGTGVFYGCTALSSISIPSSVTSLGQGAFGNCTGIKSVTIPNSVTKIKDITFTDCIGITSITIPATVTSIGEWAFYNCNGLTNINIPSSVTSIGKSSFSNITGLSVLSIPNSVTTIGENAFSYCPALSSVTLPNTIKKIESGTFAYCSGLTSVSIPNTVTAIDNYAFYYCGKLNNVIIPSSVTSIGSGVFFACNTLSNITIPNSVTSIGTKAFYNCPKLTQITIPNKLTSIESNTFYGCNGLTKVIIPNTVTKIGASAFYGCTRIKSINIPSNVTSIGSNSFTNCTSLDSIFAYPASPVNLSTSTNVFSGVNKTTSKIYVPFGKSSLYKNANQWLDFTNILEMYTNKTQQIALISGWNLISANIIPSKTDLKDVFQTLIDGGKLNKVMDESGKAIENFVALGGWNNGIGNFSPSEGYKVYMTSPDTLKIDGQTIDLPFDIILTAGWNIISYPSLSVQNALAIIQPLIDGGKLKKVMDESGKSIEDFGLFGGWKNDIGNFNPGKGFKILMNEADTLKITSIQLKSAQAITTPVVLKSTYFETVYEDNGTDHMNINLVDLSSSLLKDGDEIGLYDGDLCVGSAKISSEQIEIGSISIPTSCNDGMEGTLNGFTPGHTLTLRLKSEGSLYNLNLDVLMGSSLFEKNGSLFASVESKEFLKFVPTEISTSKESAQIGLYPNPFVEEITIDVINTESKELTVEIFSLSGQKIKVLYNGNKESLHIIWNGTDEKGKKLNPGVYLCKINNITKKIVFTGGK